MNIAFFSESSVEGKIPRNFPQMRTEYAWYVALDVTHHFVGKLSEFEDKKYDLGVIIVPKNHIEEMMKFPVIEQMKRVCKKVGFMQEGPCWFFQDYSMEQQVWYFNLLMEVDVILAHNQSDVEYYKGLTQKTHVYQNPSLMITDEVKPTTKPEDRSGVIIGGNMVRWYGGFDSYIVAREFGETIYAPSMGRKIEHEDRMGIQHLPYMTWIDWMNNLSRFKYATHLMPTQAAGTFALNCAYHGIPCIGYKGLDTQELCFPHLSVDIGDLNKAKILVEKLKKDKDFYKDSSDKAIKNCEEFFSESSYIKKWKNIKESFNETN